MPDRTASILIVDDEPANLKLLRSMLAERGFVVRFATTGTMALDSVRAQASDLILLDIELPDLTGYEVCTRLKSEPETSGIPILFISAANDAAAKVRSFQVGGVDYISKPFQTEEVLARIDHQLTIHRQRLQIERQAARLQDLDALKSRFFADISHEFRTPLMLTTGLVERVREGHHGAISPEARDELDRAVLHAHRLEELIAQILDLSRAESGVTRLRARPLDLHAQLEQIINSFAPLAERQRITLRLTAARPQVSVFADPEALTKVVTNLLSNAFKNTRPGGRIDVVVRLQDADVAVEVRDTGMGIPADVLPHIFDRFYHREGNNESAHPGTGIGLALARELVQRHHGQLTVASREGEGSTFTVLLPLGREHLSDDEVLTAADTGEAARARDLAVRSAEAFALATDPSPVDDDAAFVGEDLPTVLIVDDNAEVRRYLRSRLAPTYRVVEAADGREGLSRVREVLPDLVVTDLQMPRINGTELCRAIKADPELDFIPVILLTVKADTEHRVEGLEAGADDYLTKPFDATELQLRIRNLIQSRQRLRERLSTEKPGIVPAEQEPVSTEEQFRKRLHIVVGANLADPDFTVENLASHLAQDRTTLYRWMRRLFGQSPSDVLRSIRLQHGASLLSSRSGTVSEIAYGVGFRSVQHFVRCFKNEYGVTPSVYMMQTDTRTPARDLPTV